MGLLSDIVNPITSYYEGKARLRGARAGADIANQGYDKVVGQAGDLNRQQQAIWDPYEAYGAQGRTALQDMLVDTDQFNTPDFNYTGTVDDFLTPAMDFMRKQGVLARDQSAVAGGHQFSTGYDKDLEAFGQGLGSQEYGNAFNRLTQDKTQQLQKYNAVLDQSRQARQQRMEGLQGMVRSGELGSTNSANALSNFYGTQQQATMGKAGVNSNMAALEEQQKGAFPLALSRSLAGIGDAGISAYSFGGGTPSSFMKLFNDGKQPFNSDGLNNPANQWGNNAVDPNAVDPNVKAWGVSQQYGGGQAPAGGYPFTNSFN